MPPKRGSKRKASEKPTTSSNVNGDPVATIDRENWPGWVEIESDPLLFTTLLKDMGVRGIGVHDMESGLDDFSLVTLPKPIHAFIFLFRYAEIERDDKSPTSCPNDVWFANQVPEFACATFALLNIVNNIPDLELGRELQKFKDFTHGMDPLSRGDAVDSFDFVRRIHNSFAREKDMLEADMAIKNKADKYKKRKAAEKASKTKAAKKKAQASGNGVQRKSTNAGAKTSGRTRPATKKNGRALADGSDDDFAPSKSKLTRKAAPSNRKARAKSVSPPTVSDEEEDDPSTKNAPNTNGVRESARGRPKKVIEVADEPEETRDDDLEAAIKASLEDAQPNGEAPAKVVRRSARPPKPRKTTYSAVADESEEAGFHFVAYMPINGHVWMLDGMDRFPTDVGSYTDANNGGDWLRVAMPALQARMAATDDIRATLLAVTHDDLYSSRKDLIANIKAIKRTEQKLADIMNCWREMDGAETPKDAMTGPAPALGLKQEDVDAADLEVDLKMRIEKADGDMLKLITLRSELLTAQPILRGAVRDLYAKEKSMDEQAARRKHDYGRFVRGWVGALAGEGMLSALLENAEEAG
ncbi:Ubiquitin carboxyl-terminal hydrolase [Teratosphaeria destructans]|uniref:Ubiquitin carboxyl-terminal hydrolase n=1 Tax=Teratosphaeria destructans TaxID=418781 RepID=A0A9W7W2D7_9PEZI|nr:Ubiquitin carboxyl-terminal hydrolase [Teratosphaeria destructans]